MPEKTKNYGRVIFTPEVIRKAVDVIRETLPGGTVPDQREVTSQTFTIKISPEEEWDHDSEEEFFTDYRKGYKYALYRKSYGHGGGRIELWAYEDQTRVSITMPSRSDLEKVFNIFESNVEKCRLPRQPKLKSKIKTDWITETLNKIEGRCPVAGRKLKLALIKLDSEEAEEWQNATMLVRDAWIELTQWLCKVNNIDTLDISPDAVIDRLRKLKIDKTDERLFNLARASFNLYGKHHKRNIDNDAAVACVISTVVSMQTVIREVFNTTGKG